MHNEYVEQSKAYDYEDGKYFSNIKCHVHI